jgi:hypothetical protein
LNIRLSVLGLIPLAMICFFIVTSYNISGFLSSSNGDSIKVSRDEMQIVNTICLSKTIMSTYRLHYQINISGSTGCFTLTDKISSNVKLELLTQYPDVKTSFDKDSGILMIKIVNYSIPVYDLIYSVEVPNTDIFLPDKSPVLTCEPDHVPLGDSTEVKVIFSSFELQSVSGLKKVRLLVFPATKNARCDYISSCSQSNFTVSDDQLIWSYESNKRMYDEHIVSYHVSVPDFDGNESLYLKSRLDVFYDKHIVFSGPPHFDGGEVVFVDAGVCYRYQSEFALT